MDKIISFIMHIDKNLVLILNNYGALSYGIVFLIIFAETGFVVTPFLPGDSLIFAIGALSVKGGFNLFGVYVLLLIAAIAGDALNYWLGKHFGRAAFKKIPLFSEDDLEKTEAFYKKHGGKTIIMARFIPIVRTFAPFVAGVSKMPYSEFGTFNIVGGFLWITSFLFLGYFFGNIPVVEKNFSLVIIAIIALSVLPALYEFIATKVRKK
jgi:membrane-associated protein